jgi:hypothetical protein
MIEEQNIKIESDLNRKLTTIVAIITLKLEEIILHIFIIRTIHKLFQQQKQGLNRSEN